MNKNIFCIFVLSLVLLFYAYCPADDSCLTCHGDSARMNDLGFPQFTVTAEDARAQTRMPASCSDCHLGDPQGKTANESHKNLLTVKAVKNKTWEPVSRSAMSTEDLALWQYIEPRGENRATELSPKLLYRNKPRD
ncbi:MAG: hypothetical protein OEW04_15325, partial [Nitrospirota bacterium]|nr:hypothetical protein [Nitrospirota bacterium]